jgi:hypothetical protein
MPTLSDQIDAVLRAPTLFFLTFFALLLAIAATLWRTFDWRYKAVFDKQKELYDLSRLEVDRWKDRAEQTTEDAVKQIEQLSAELEKEKHLSTQAKVQLDQLKTSTSQLTVQLTALGQANSSVTGPTGAARGAGQSLGLSSPSRQRSP